MQFEDKEKYVAIARFVRFSPYKLRPFADVIRGKSVQYALNWLATYATKRVSPMKKVLESAAANAKNLANIKSGQLFIKDIRVDQGPMFRYFRAGAMGRANVYRKRFSHISVVLERIDNQREA